MTIRRQVLRDEVQEMILKMLLEMRYPAGERLSIDGLARKLGVSPTPVREAMVALENSGLVNYVALRGYVVAPMLTSEQINELVDARIIVESAAVTRAFAQWDVFASGLEKAQIRHAKVVERIDPAPELSYDLLREHFQADWEFHKVAFDLCGNRYLTTIQETLRPHTHRMRQAWDGEPTELDANEAIAEHGEILRNVLDRNHDGTLAALREHLDAVRSRSLAAQHHSKADTRVA